MNTRQQVSTSRSHGTRQLVIMIINWMGIYPPTEYIKRTYIGDSILKVGNIFTPNGIYERSLYMGYNGWPNGLRRCYWRWSG